MPSPAGVFIYSFHMSCPFPAHQWSFPHTTALISFPTPVCWANATTNAFSSQLFCLRFCEGLLSPPFWHSGRPTLFAMYLFYCCCLLFSLFCFSFFPGWGSDLAQGCLWDYSMLLISSGGLSLPKQSGSWHLVPWEPSWFLHLMWNGDAVLGLGVWRSQGFAFSQWFFL
jgi:hypothetical protein